MTLIGIAALAVLLSAPAASAGVHVHDGDTITLDGTKIRIAAIDAPELDQQCRDSQGRCVACGQASKQYLLGLLARGAPSCDRVDVDRYGRTVSTCSVAGQDIGEAMIRAGHAVAYTRYLVGDQTRRYPAAEVEAKIARRGIHGGTFDRPDAWRRGNRMQCNR